MFALSKRPSLRVCCKSVHNARLHRGTNIVCTAAVVQKSISGRMAELKAQGK